MLSPDAMLVKLTLQGDQDAFARLVERHQQGLLNRALSEISNQSEAEEIVQEAFFHAYQHLETLKKPEKFASWIYRITCNLCHDTLRERHVIAELLKAFNAINMPNGPVKPNLPDEEYETSDNLIKAVDTLSDNNKGVFLLYLKGYSYQDIATDLHISTSTVSGRIQQAKQQLRAVLSRNPDFIHGPFQFNQEYLRKEIDKMLE